MTAKWSVWRFLKRTTSDSDNIGYLIPTVVAKNFLRNLELSGGHFTGLPELGFDYQSLDNPVCVAPWE